MTQRKLIFTAFFILVAGFILSGCSVPKACTKEAKLCPDGSSVGRTGPNCEFSPCPVAKLELSQTDLKYLLIEKFNDKIQVCGPPVQRVDDQAERLKQFEEFAKTEEFKAIINHKGLTNNNAWSEEVRLMILEEQDKLSAINL